MKEGIHPRYGPCTVTCGCGNSFHTRSTLKTIAVEICSTCHPFYTGKQKFIDTAGRVEKFMRRYNMKGESVVDARKTKGAPAEGPAPTPAG